MSIQKNHYIMIAVKFEYDEYLEAIRPSFLCDDEAFGSWLDKIETPFKDNAFGGIESKEGISIIADGMNGKYVYIGQVLSKSKDHEDHFSFTQEPMKKEDIEKKIYDLLGLDVEVEHFNFTHCR